VVKHAGLCPRENASGHHQGKTTISGRGRPELRLAAWRAVWTAMHNNPVLKGRFNHLTTRPDNKLAAQQARAAYAAALLRWLHVIVTQGVRWDPAIAAGETITAIHTRAA
jgi:transposase